jgi:RHS repeat-associated protein
MADATGTATATYTYSAEGIPGGTTGGRFKYTGQQNLEGLSLYYYKARMYSYELGRFLQTDPIGIEDDLNLYAYVGNNSINRLDPSGKNAVFNLYYDYNLSVTLNYVYTGISGTTMNQVKFDNAILNSWNGSFSSPIPYNPVNFSIDLTINSQIASSAAELGYYQALGYSAINLNNGITRSETYVTGTFFAGGGNWAASGSGWEGAHETGHVMGLRDQYRDVLGASVPYAGYAGNIMASNPGSVDGRNYSSILNGVLGLNQVGSGTSSGYISPSLSPLGSSGLFK